MKTINDTLPELKPLFEFLIENGWKQPTEGFADRFALIHPTKGYIAETLEWPRPYIGIISQNGAELLDGTGNLIELRQILIDLL